MNEYDKGFIACYLETDGSLGLYNQKGTNRKYPKISFANNSDKLLNKVNQILIQNQIIKTPKRPTLVRSGYGECKKLQIQSIRECLKLLEWVGELVEKENGRQEILEYFENV